MDNPWADGVEPTVKEVKRHLLALCLEERISHKWSDPTVLPVVQYILNSRDHSQTGTSPYALTFGDRSSFLSEFSPHDTNWLLDEGGRKAYAKQLAENLAFLIERSKIYQASLLKEKQENSESDPATEYVKGEFVFHRRRNIIDVETLTARNEGPFEVNFHKKDSNTVNVRDLIKNNYRDFHMSELIRFKGNAQQAYELALTDNNQFVIKEILGYSGTPAMRSTMEFKVHFVNGTVSWLPWQEISETEALAIFISESAYLRILRWKSYDVKKLISRYKKAFIEESLIGTTFFMNLRAFGASLYSTFTAIEDRFCKDYYLSALIVSYVQGKNGIADKKNVNVRIFSLKNEFFADAFFLFLHAANVNLPPNGTLIKTMKQFKALKLSSDLIPSDEFNVSARSEKI